jgi:hypothetical protein
MLLYQVFRFVPSAVAPRTTAIRDQRSNQHVFDEVLSLIVPDEPENKRLHMHYSFSGFGHARAWLLSNGVANSRAMHEEFKSS